MDTKTEISNHVSVQAKEISDRFLQIKNMLTKYESEIFASLDSSTFLEETDAKIKNELRKINGAIKPYHILKIGQDFVKAIENTIDDPCRYTFDDDRNILKKVFDPYNTYRNVFYDYKLKSDYRLDECFTWEEKEAYKIIRNAVQNFLENKKKEWIEIWFSKAYYENVDCGRIHISVKK